MCIDNVQRPLILVLALTAALAACSGSGEKSQTQVVARVNGEEAPVLSEPDFIRISFEHIVSKDSLIEITFQQ